MQASIAAQQSTGPIVRSEGPPVEQHAPGAAEAHPARRRKVTRRAVPRDFIGSLSLEKPFEAALMYVHHSEESHLKVQQKKRRVQPAHSDRFPALITRG